jgi:hypothetical protein
VDRRSADKLAVTNPFPGPPREGCQKGTAKNEKVGNLRPQRPETGFGPFLDCHGVARPAVERHGRLTGARGNSPATTPDTEVRRYNRTVERELDRYHVGRGGRYKTPDAEVRRYNRTVERELDRYHVGRGGALQDAGRGGPALR